MGFICRPTEIFFPQVLLLIFFFFEITPSLGLCQVHFRCELGFPTLKAVFWFAYSVLLPLLAITLLGVIRGVLSFRCENVYALW